MTITAFNAGTNHSSIPPTAKLPGTVRTFPATSRDLAERRIREIAEGVASAQGAAARVDFIRRYPPTVNHHAETEHLRRAAQAVGPVDGTRPHMGAEDFALMLVARPGAFVFPGNGPSADLHTPADGFDDAPLPYGIALWTTLLRQRLAPAQR